jgi:hypothetical protein
LIFELESRLAPVTMRRMKTQLLARIVLAGVAVLLLQACATTPPSGPAALTGTWTNSLGTVWTMNADGSFDVDLNKDGKRDLWGTAKVEGDMVTVAETGGTVPKGCAKTTGVYRFTRSKDTLHFTLVKDSCKERVKNVTLDWTKK